MGGGELKFSEARKNGGLGLALGLLANSSNQSLANSFDLCETLLFIFEKIGGL